MDKFWIVNEVGAVITVIDGIGMEDNFYYECRDRENDSACRVSKAWGEIVGEFDIHRDREALAKIIGF